MNFLRSLLSPLAGNRWLLLCLLVAMWGSAFAFTKLALDAIPPVWVVAFRLALPAALLVPAALAMGRLPRDRASWGWVVVIALLGNIAPFFVISWGQQHLSSALAGILVGATPLLTLAIAQLAVPDERIGFRRIAGFCVGFSGLVLVVGPQALFEFRLEATSFLAQLAVLAGALCFAANNVAARRMPDMPLLTKASGTMASGAVIGLLIAGGVQPHEGFADMQPLGWSAMAALGLFSTGLAALVFFRLVEKAGPAFTSLTNYLVPVCAAGLGYVVFGEDLQWRVLGGLALILAGIAVSELRLPSQKEGKADARHHRG